MMWLQLNKDYFIYKKYVLCTCTMIYKHNFMNVTNYSIFNLTYILIFTVKFSHMIIIVSLKDLQKVDVNCGNTCVLVLKLRQI